MKHRGTRWWIAVLAFAATLLALLVLRKVAATRLNLPTGDRVGPSPVVTFRLVDEALAEKNVSAAVRAWHRAYVAALASRHREGLIDAGDAYLRIGQLSTSRRLAEAKARSLYLSALFRARQQESLDGVLRAAEAFAALGDTEAVEQCLRVADQVAARNADRDGPARVKAFAEQWATGALPARGSSGGT
jgi:hypothetical protein